MEQNPAAIDKEVANVLSGMGLKAEALSIKDEVKQALDVFRVQNRSLRPYSMGLPRHIRHPARSLHAQV